MPRLQEPELLATAPRPSPGKSSERRAFIERLKTYGMGVLIGCVIAAMLFIMRAQMTGGQPPQVSPTPSPAPAAPR